MTRAPHRTHRMPTLLVMLALLAGMLVALPASVSAAGTTEVTNCDDSGAGSLRAAVAAANGDVTATPGDPHVITFDPALACDTILLGGTQLLLSNHMRIEGPGAAALTVSGGGVSRVFEVSAGVTASISGLTISNGSAVLGGGIYSEGVLTITDSVISGNNASIGGGLYINGMLTITTSMIEGNAATIAGGMYIVGDVVTITASTLRDNRAGIAAGIYSHGVLTITASTINSNDADDAAGGIYSHGTVTITSSTISGNTADELFGGGIAVIIGSVAIINSTITANGASTGGGIALLGGSLTLTATIVAGNDAETGPDIAGSVSGTGNLLGDTTDSSGLTDGVDRNIVGTSSSPVNPLLDALDSNGGPTQTHALQAGSPAIDHIPSGQCAVNLDQRGVVRPQNGACDIGAFEVYVQNNYQACLFAGSLTQVSGVGSNDTPNPGLNCGRGTAIVIADGANTDTRRSFACLYAGSLSQVGPMFGDPPLNCGRGTLIALASGDELLGCLYAGRLSQVGYSEPSNCGRGELLGLALATYQNDN